MLLQSMDSLSALPSQPESRTAVMTLYTVKCVYTAATSEHTGDCSLYKGALSTSAPLLLLLSLSFLQFFTVSKSVQPQVVSNSEEFKKLWGQEQKKVTAGAERVARRSGCS